jgi:hypothetical protein
MFFLKERFWKPSQSFFIIQQQRFFLSSQHNNVNAGEEPLHTFVDSVYIKFKIGLHDRFVLILTELNHYITKYGHTSYLQCRTRIKHSKYVDLEPINPTTVSENASVVKIYNVVRFENNFFLTLW